MKGKVGRGRRGGGVEGESGTVTGGRWKQWRVRRWETTTTKMKSLR